MKTIILALALACAAVTAPAGRVEEEAKARHSPPSKETMARPTWATQTMSASFADTLTTQGQPRRVLKGNCTLHDAKIKCGYNKTLRYDDASARFLNRYLSWSVVWGRPGHGTPSPSRSSRFRTLSGARSKIASASS